MKILRCLGFLLYIFLAFLMMLSGWFVAQWGDVGVSSAIYQLNSPLQGTSSEILFSFVVDCIVPVVIILLITLLLLIFKTGKLEFIFDFRVFGSNFSVRFGGKVLKIFSRWMICALTAFFVILSLVNLNRAGFTDYIREITSVTTFYEENYIDPDTVKINFPREKRNLVYIYLESMETTYASTDVGGGKPVNLIPGLTELAFDSQNVYFSDDSLLGGAKNSFGSGWTMAAILAGTSGVPYALPIGGNDAGEFAEFMPGITVMGDVLEENGYSNYFVCGSQSGFGGRKQYFSQHGDYTIFDYDTAIEEGFIPKDYYVFWGMEDSKLYEYAKEKLTEISSKTEPFNFTMLTVDTHHFHGYVCDLCEDNYPEQYANVIACADRQIISFINWMKEQEWYKNTTVIIVGDYRSMNNDFWNDIGDYERHPYNLFVNLPQDILNQGQQNSKNRIFTTEDLFPTTLHALGATVEGNRLGLGTDLFSSSETYAEEMGIDAFNSEVGKHSNYYDRVFIYGSK